MQFITTSDPVCVFPHHPATSLETVLSILSPRLVLAISPLHAFPGYPTGKNFVFLATPLGNVLPVFLYPIAELFFESALGCFLQSYHVRSGPHALQFIRPPLRQLPALFDISCPVVGSTDRVAVLVG